MSQAVVPPVTFRAGNIQYHLAEWEEITSDLEVLQIVQGIKLDFWSFPTQNFVPRPYRVSEQDGEQLKSQIHDLVLRGIVERISNAEAKYISNVFIRPKSNGKYRMIVDMSKLNDNIEKKHFKMDHLQVAIDMMKPNSFMASIDLKDAYYTVPIHKEFQQYMCIQWDSQVFKFTAMPFGLTSAPRLFTKLLRPVFSILHEKGFCGFGYIDDSFLIGDSIEEC